MTDILLDVYKQALISGVKAVDFWDMSYGEIMETIEAHTERMNREQETRAAMDYRLANLIGFAMNDPKKFPKTVKAAYPFVRKHERVGTWQDSKAEFAARAAAHNRTIGGGVP